MLTLALLAILTVFAPASLSQPLGDYPSQVRWEARKRAVRGSMSRAMRAQRGFELTYRQCAMGGLLQPSIWRTVRRDGTALSITPSRLSQVRHPLQTLRGSQHPWAKRLCKIAGWRPKSRRDKLLLLAAASALAFATYWTLGLPLPIPFVGAARTWMHAAGNNWNAVGNWDGGASIPAAGDSVTFSDASTASCTVDVATAALIGFTVTTGYTGTITVSNAIDTDDLDVDFGGAGGWAGTAAIVLTPGGDVSITSDQALPALTISPTAAANVTFGGAIAVTGATIVNTNATVALGATAPTFTGDVTINSGGTINKTSATGAVNTNGNWTVAAGGTLSLTGAGQVFNQNTGGKQVTINGTITATGAVGNHIAWLTSYALMIGNGSTINLQYVTFTNNGTSDYCLQFGGAPAAVTNLDNLVLNKKAGSYAGLYVGFTTTLATFTNCTFAGVEGADYYQQHIFLAVDRHLRLSNCTFTDIGWAGTNTSGWVSSITDQGVANAHVFYGILSASTPAAAYQIADADNVTIKNGVNQVAVNSVLTLDQAETVADLTTSASTTAKLNGNITFTFATITNDGAFEFADNTVNAAVLSEIG